MKGISKFKTSKGISTQLRTCHTAIVDGYIIKDHVPAEQVIKLLQIKPDIIGLSVPGIPIGSPGMESDTIPVEFYNVIAFDPMGRT